MKENNGERIQIPVPHDNPKDARLETDTAVSGHVIRKRRIYACIAIAVILLGVGVLHLINPVEHTIIPCLFYELTGIPCFGCGTTRCLYFLSRFDFANAFRYNAYLTVLSPLLLYWSGAELLNALAGRTLLPVFRRKWSSVIVLLIGLILFGILRWIFPALRFGVL